MRHFRVDRMTQLRVLRDVALALESTMSFDEVLTLANINNAFRGPRVMFAYYQGGLTCQFVEETWGFPALLSLLDGFREGLPLEANLARALGADPSDPAQNIEAGTRHLRDLLVGQILWVTTDQLLALQQQWQARG